MYIPIKRSGSKAKPFATLSLIWIPLPFLVLGVLMIVVNGVSDYLGWILAAVGAAGLAFLIADAARDFRRNKFRKETSAAEPLPREELTEYYVRYTMDVTRPGYILEDGERNVLAEIIHEQKPILGGKAFTNTNRILLTDHRTGRTTEHRYGGKGEGSTKVGRVRFNERSIRIDGMDGRDLLQQMGVRVDIVEENAFATTKMEFHVTRDGVYFADIETCGWDLHEEDEGRQEERTGLAGLVDGIPTKLNLRCWLNGEDLETLLLIAYIIAETHESVSVSIPKMKFRI